MQSYMHVILAESYRFRRFGAAGADGCVARECPVPAHAQCCRRGLGAGWRPAWAAVETALTKFWPAAAQEGTNCSGGVVLLQWLAVAALPPRALPPSPPLVLSEDPTKAALRHSRLCARAAGCRCHRDLPWDSRSWSQSRSPSTGVSTLLSRLKVAAWCYQRSGMSGTHWCRRRKS